MHGLSIQSGADARELRRWLAQTDRPRVRQPREPVDVPYRWRSRVGSLLAYSCDRLTRSRRWTVIVRNRRARSVYRVHAICSAPEGCQTPVTLPKRGANEVRPSKCTIRCLNRHHFSLYSSSSHRRVLRTRPTSRSTTRLYVANLNRSSNRTSNSFFALATFVVETFAARRLVQRPALQFPSWPLRP